MQWDQDGSVLLDYLDRAGIENESWLCEIPAVDMGLGEGEDVPGVAVEIQRQERSARPSCCGCSAEKRNQGARPKSASLVSGKR